MMTTAQYIYNINGRNKLGNATKHTFRGELTQLIKSIVSNIKAKNEPQRQKYGAPDYVQSRRAIEMRVVR